MTEQDIRIRFTTHRHPRVATFWRAITSVAALASFIPGVVIIVGALTVGEKSFALVGIWFLAVPAFIWWSIWRLAYEVTVVGDRVLWSGPWSSGSAPLKALRSVRASRFRGAVLAFRFDGSRGFEIEPVRGIERLLDAIQQLHPGIEVRFPRTLRWWGRLLPRGRFEGPEDPMAPDEEGDQPERDP